MAGAEEPGFDALKRSRWLTAFPSSDTVEPLIIGDLVKTLGYLSPDDRGGGQRIERQFTGGAVVTEGVVRTF